MGAEPIFARFYARFTHIHRLLCNPKKRAENGMTKNGLENRRCKQGFICVKGELHMFLTRGKFFGILVSE